MEQWDWLVMGDGICQPRPTARSWDLIRERYYLHHFLTEIIDILESAPCEAEEWDYLPQIRMRVRQLILNSYWVQTRYVEPSPTTGVSVLTLYDEIGYPLTVQVVVTAPGTVSPIHNHGTWGVVAVLKGSENHILWRRIGDSALPDKIERVQEKLLTSGEIISFTPDAIHQVEVVGDQPSVTFNLYGDTQPRSRFEFEPTTHTAKYF